MLNHRSTRVLCSYPAGFDPRISPPSTNNLFLYGPRIRGFAIAIATRIDQVWLVAADRSVRPGRVVRLSLAGQPHIVIVAATRTGRHALAGIVTTRNHRIVGALLAADRRNLPAGAATAPCFLAAPSAGAPPATPACRDLMATANRIATSASP